MQTVVPTSKISITWEFLKNEKCEAPTPHHRIRSPGDSYLYERKLRKH